MNAPQQPQQPDPVFGDRERHKRFVGMVAEALAAVFPEAKSQTVTVNIAPLVTVGGRDRLVMVEARAIVVAPTSNIVIPTLVPPTRPPSRPT